MKAKPVKLIDHQWVEVSKEEGTHIHLIFPLSIKVGIPNDPTYEYYPLRNRYIPYQLNGDRANTGKWTWNGDIDKPTLRPSILTAYQHHRCHSFVNDGKIQFLSDCSHDLVGQTVDLLEV